MTISQSDIVQVARSREKFDDQPVIDLTVLEAEDAIEILEGQHKPDHKNSENPAPLFKPSSLRKRNIIVAIAIVIALILVPPYADRIIQGNNIANGVSVDGIDIGGKSLKQAEIILNEAAKKSLNQPLVFSLGETTISISPQDLDLQFNVKETLAAAQKVNRSLSPLSVVPSFAKRYTSGTDLAPLFLFDKTKFDEVETGIENSLSKGRADAGIQISNTDVKIIEPKSGQGVSTKQAQNALRSAIQSFSRNKTALRSEKVEAQISLKEAQETKAILDIMFSQPSTLSTPGGNAVSISPIQLAQATVVTPDSKNLLISINEEKLRSSIPDQISTVEVASKDASFAVNGSSVSVIPSVPGKTIDFDSAIRKWITGEHIFEVSVKETQPKRDTNWAQSLNITETVSSFTTNFPPAQIRVKNIARAASVVNNTIVEPGEIFSLNKALGKRTQESGYFKAPVFSSEAGFTEDFGGGVSQFSTTLFNAAFIGGYKNITHSPHTIYIPRYPMGREATLNFGSIDMSFQNDSKSGMFVKTSVGSTSVTVTIYGNKEGRKVSLEGPKILGEIPIETIYTDDPNLPVGKEKETSKGFPGINVENFRTISRPGEPDKKERYRWTYKMIPRKVTRGTKPVAETTVPTTVPV